MCETQQKFSGLEHEVTMLIHSFGVPANLKGYYYLREAIIVMVKNGCGQNMTTDIYPKVAAMYDSTPYRIERDIRSAITISWEKDGRAGAKAFTKHYSLAEVYASRPSNGEYISTIADELRLKYI